MKWEGSRCELQINLYPMLWTQGKECTNHDSRITANELPLAVLPVEFQELHGRGLLDLQSKVAGDLPQRVIEMRKMVEGHVAHKGTPYFIIARTAMQPPEKEGELDKRGEANNDPIGIHGSGVRRVSSVEAK